MCVYSRYAIYFTPSPGDFATMGANWLGWDSATGTQAKHPQVEGLPAPVADLTKRPRKYGFHGTIKPPFRLAKQTTRTQLEEAASDLMGSLSPVMLEGLQVTRLGQFLALTPVGDAAALAALAAQIVEGLDRFRAPAPPEELTRRRAAGLSPRQETNLITWGYPYVMDDFRFHMTLTGPLSKDSITPVQDHLTARFAPVTEAPFRIDGMTLLGEDAAGMFHEIHRYPLLGNSAPST